MLQLHFSRTDIYVAWIQYLMNSLLNKAGGNQSNIVLIQYNGVKFRNYPETVTH